MKRALARRVFERATSGGNIRTLALAVLTLASCAAPAAKASTTTTTVATIAEPSPVSAFQNNLVWSAYDPTRKTYFLTARIGKQIQRLPLQPSTLGFNPELGPGPSGSVWAVYTRCKKAKPTCPIYRYSFSDKKEKNLSVSGANPAIWSGNLVFVRPKKHRDQLVVHSLRRKTERGLTGAPRGWAISDIAIWRNSVAYAADNFDTDAAVWLTSTNSHSSKRILSRGIGESGFSWVGPSFDRGSLYISGLCVVDGGCGSITAYSLRTHKHSRASGGPDNVGSFSRANGISYYDAVDLDDSNQQVCTTLCDIVEAHGQKFKPVR